jgi:hypothetical protein
MNFEIAPKETEIQANWGDARLYCFALNIDGKTDPVINQLDTHHTAVIYKKIIFSQG